MNQSREVPAARYPKAAVVLHWTLALLILALLASGWYMVDIPRNTDARAFWFNLHKSIGVLTAFFIVALIVWRARHASPPLPSAMPRWERAAAHLNHTLFYLSMVLITVAGYLTSSFSKYAVKFFGIELPHWGWDDAALRGNLADVHRVSAYIFALLIVVHVAAAVKHLVVDKDGVFERMSLGER